MTTTSVTSSIVNTLGGGSGIDMTALAESLATAQFAARTDRLDTQSQTLDSQISAASSLKNQLLSLSSAMGDRVRNGDLAAKPSVANPAVATASAGTGGGGEGIYALEVSALAQGQVLASPAYSAASDTVGSGTLTIRFGTVSGGTFAQDTAHAAVDVAIPAGATLNDVASAINGADAGVLAYVAQTTDGAKLVLKGANGATNGFVLDASEDPADPGLAALAWNPAGDAARLKSGASDAAFSLDGVAMTSSSNTLTDVAPGLSLALTGTNAGAPTTIRFSDPSASIDSAMNDLVGALNSIVQELAKDTDSTTGDLVRDPGARALRSTLSALPGKTVMPNAADGSPKTLADLGLRINRDGTFDIDAKRLSDTLARDPAGAAAMFTTGLYGVYSTIDAMARTATSASNPGSLGGSITRYTAKQTDVTDRKAKIADQQEAMRQRLVGQFAKVDSRVSGYHSTLTFLQSQIAAWNAKGN
ncbi:flagellar filament capping protein FliD [Novosphingobium sp. ZN18A2]|uniref:flagellar filament capping protein FliD n=1 Tax=Novosphingobium sp. ZN18A2 TaxID=3079861 RepID=UPI0030CEA5AF